MQTYLTTITSYLHALSLRERILVLFVLTSVLYVLMDNFVLRQLNQELRQQISQQQTLSQQQQDNEIAIIEITKKSKQANAADKAQQQQIESLKQQLEQREQQLESSLQSLVPPTQMSALLKSLLAQQQSSLKLISLESEPVKTITLNENDEQQVKLYEHATTIELAGNYQDLHQYLAKLETSKWQLFWDQLHYSVTKHPDALITLRVHTISPNEYWIGL